MNSMDLSKSVKNTVISSFECDNCHTRLEEGEFIAVIGKTPASGMSMPLGRADAILKKIGTIYCEKCFKE